MAEVIEEDEWNRIEGFEGGDPELTLYNDAASSGEEVNIVNRMETAEQPMSVMAVPMVSRLAPS